MASFSVNGVIRINCNYTRYCHLLEESWLGQEEYSLLKLFIIIDLWQEWDVPNLITPGGDEKQVNLNQNKVISSVVEYVYWTTITFSYVAKVNISFAESLLFCFFLSCMFVWMILCYMWTPGIVGNRIPNQINIKPGQLLNVSSCGQCPPNFSINIPLESQVHQIKGLLRY